MDAARKGIRAARLLDELRGLLLGDQVLDDGVVARAAIDDVGPGAADQHVVTRAPEEGVVAGPAEDDVVAVAAVRRELD